MSNPTVAAIATPNAPGGIGGRVNTDVRTMSDSEFDAYIKKIKNT